MTMQAQLLQTALANLNLSLVQSATMTRTLLNELAEISGVPAIALLSAKHRMLQRSSFLPLQALFADPTVPKAPGLRYRIGVRQLHKGLLAKGQQGGPNGRRAQACRLVLDVASARGRLQIVFDLRIEERAGTAAVSGSTPQPQQNARLTISYRVKVGPVRRSFKQSMVVSANAASVHQSRSERIDAA